MTGGTGKPIVVTGSASGIGRATVDRLRGQGRRVIGVDLRDAEVEVDLGTSSGRDAMIDAVTALARDGLDGVVASAGLEKPDRPVETLAVNFFGAVATLDGLRPLLARGSRPRAVAIASTAALYPGDPGLVDLCLAGIEAEALAAVRDLPGAAYVSSKQALCQWARRTAVRPDWAGAGILLNTIAPGVVRTPMTQPRLATAQSRELVARSSPIAVGDYVGPDVIAELIDYLVSFEGPYLLGQVIFVDGGADAILRPAMV